MTVNENARSIVGWMPEESMADSVEVRFGVSRILHHSRSAYQDILIFDVPGFGRVLQLDGCLQSCEYDAHMYHEPLVHVPSILQGGPKKVLILGAGEGAAAYESLRWNTVERLLMLDIDREAVEACRQHMAMLHHHSFDDPRVELLFCDAVEFLQQTEEKWDLVIGDLTDPDDGGLSQRVFSEGMFAQLKDLLEPGGVLVMQGGGMFPNLVERNVELLQTAQQVFSCCRYYANWIPSLMGPNCFLVCASDELPYEQWDEGQVDRLLQQHVQGELLCMDGQSFLDVFRLPLYVRRAIASRKQTVR